jgi:hypothetical protein
MHCIAEFLCDRHLQVPGIYMHAKSSEMCTHMFVSYRGHLTNTCCPQDCNGYHKVHPVVLRKLHI